MRYPNAVYAFVHFLARTFYDLYGSWEIIGHHHIPPSGPVIVTPNHVSYLDPPLVGAAIRRECAFMARHDLWDNKVLNWLLPHLGAFPVRRGEPDRAAMRRALDELARGKVLIMFPEGTRSPDGALQQGEPGVALIVQRSGAPVVPCAVIGSEQMMSPGRSGIRRARLKVVFGHPIPFTRDHSREEIVTTIMRAIADLLAAHGRERAAQPHLQNPSAGMEVSVNSATREETYMTPNETRVSAAEPIITADGSVRELEKAAIAAQEHPHPIRNTLKDDPIISLGKDPGGAPEDAVRDPTEQP